MVLDLCIFLTFALEKAILCIKNWNFSCKEQFEVKNVLMMICCSFSFYKMLIGGLESCGLL